MRLYHGTTAEAYKVIMENGFDHNKVVWTCSDPNVLYFYRHDLVAQEYELNEQEAIKKCFALALESAACTAAITHSTSRHLFVYEFLIDDAHTDFVTPDRSTANVDDFCVCAILSF
jgi:regulator of RNase E activity RraB